MLASPTGIGVRYRSMPTDAISEGLRSTRTPLCALVKNVVADYPDSCHVEDEATDHVLIKHFSRLATDFRDNRSTDHTLSSIT